MMEMTRNIAMIVMGRSRIKTKLKKKRMILELQEVDQSMLMIRICSVISKEGRRATPLKPIDHVLDRSTRMFLDRFLKIFMRILILTMMRSLKMMQDWTAHPHKTQRMMKMLIKITMISMLVVGISKRIASSTTLRIWRLTTSTKSSVLQTTLQPDWPQKQGRSSRNSCDRQEPLKSQKNTSKNKSRNCLEATTRKRQSWQGTSTPLRSPGAPTKPRLYMEYSSWWFTCSSLGGSKTLSYTIIIASK